MPNADPVLERVRDVTALAELAAAYVRDAAARAVARGGRFSFVLTGGTSPVGLYERLAASPAALAWAVTDVWFGDERCVPPDDPASNYGLAWRMLLAHVPVPAANVRRIVGELGAVAAADRYDALVRGVYGAPAVVSAPNDARAANDAASGVRGFGNPSAASVPLGASSTFDLVLLGVGTEGHTASLFPDHPALVVADRWAAPVDPAPPTAKPLVPRATLTLPALLGAREVLVLAPGAEKAPVVRAVFGGGAELPAGRVRGRDRTTWLVDRAAE